MDDAPAWMTRKNLDGTEMTIETTTQDLSAQLDGIAKIAPEVQFQLAVDEQFLEAWLSDVILRNRLTFMRGARWETKKRVAHLPAEMLLGSASLWYCETALLRVRGLLAYVTIRGDSCDANVYAGGYDAALFELAIADLKAWLQPKKELSPDRVQMGFRYEGSRGSQYRSRSIEAPSWAEIRPNYAGDVQRLIDELSDGFAPGTGGRLLLLHGAPGTGKTFVIRALARQWRSWCHFEYIADPETFVGDADYMMRVLIEGHHDIDEESSDASDDGSNGRPKRWRLLVLEDAGELLSRDAKASQGQGLSRLLNMSEGLIGQGLRVVTMISTNEKLSLLNEAVSRPGRTAAEVEFAALSVAECNAWLAARGHEDKQTDAPMTLAELYALSSGAAHQRQKSRRPIGFAGSWRN